MWMLYAQIRANVEAMMNKQANSVYYMMGYIREEAIGSKFNEVAVEYITYHKRYHEP